MFSEYGFNENMLDFEDTDMFLSAILSSVPTMDRLSNPYDLGQNSSGFPFTESSAFLNNPNNSLNITADQNDSNSINSLSPTTANHERSLFASNNQKQRSSFSSASYSELVASSASNEGTPNTTILSPHTLPEGMSDNEPKKSRIVTAVKTEEKELPEVTLVSAKKSKGTAKDKVSKPGRRPKVSHNMIEKKYRTNINTKIYELRDAVPSLKIAAGKGDILLSDLEGLAPAAKLNKASVLTKATEYIKHLEKKNETMLKQIAQLQQLMGESNANPPNVVAQQSNNQFEDQFPRGFGFAPDTNYNTTVNMFEAQAPPQQHFPQTQDEYQPFNTNWIMGGLTSVVGSSVLSNENFKGLAALPFIPSFLAHPSPASLQVLAIFRVGLLLFGFYLILSPLLSYMRRRRDPKASAQNIWLTWLLTSLGLQIPKPLSPSEKDRVLSHLQNGCPSSWDWVKDYAILSSSEVNFETCFLTVLVGSFITIKLPHLSRFIKQSISVRSSLLSKLDCPENDSLKKLSQLIKKTDGASMFASEAHMTRLLNLTERKNIFTNVKKGDNSLSYIEVYKKSPKDIYAIIFGWRVLDVLYELNLSYLDFLTLPSEDEKAKESETHLREELEKIESLLEDADVLSLKQYYLSLKCLINPELTPILMSSMKVSITKTVSNMHGYFEGQDLTDNELTDESESEAESSVSTEVDDSIEITDLVSSEKSLLYSLNLVNEEKFIVLASMSILYYKQRHDVEYLRALLKHLDFKDRKVPLSTLSFACLLAVACSLLERSEDEEEDTALLNASDSEILELLVKTLRGWLNDDCKSRSFSHSFRSDLTDLVLSRGMVLQDI